MSTERADEAGAQRITPWDVVFGAASFDAGRFELVREQAAVHGGATPTELLMLPAAGELLRELLPDDSPARSHRELVAQVSALVFHGFRFWLHGRHVHTVAEPALRALLTRTEPIGTWSFRTPAPAGYVQLAHNVLWARVAADAAAEPVDGFFWSAPAAHEAARPGASERLDLLVCLGVRRGRPGFSLVEVTMEAGQALDHWADVDARPGADDFANILPGGELQHYHALVTHAEVLKLASLCFWHLDHGAAGSGAHSNG